MGFARPAVITGCPYNESVFAPPLKAAIASVKITAKGFHPLLGRISTAFAPKPEAAPSAEIHGLLRLKAFPPHRHPEVSPSGLQDRFPTCDRGKGVTSMAPPALRHRPHSKTARLSSFAGITLVVALILALFDGSRMASAQTDQPAELALRHAQKVTLEQQPQRCGRGEVRNRNGECVPRRCRSTEERNRNGECVPRRCRSGEVRRNGRCVRPERVRCPEGSERNRDGMCVRVYYEPPAVRIRL